MSGFGDLLEGVDVRRDDADMTNGRALARTARTDDRRGLPDANGANHIQCRSRVPWRILYS